MLGLLVVITVGCIRNDVAFPDRVLDPEVVGVVVEQRQGSTPTSRVYELDGPFVEINPSDDVELGGSGPGEGRLLIVARDGDTTYYLGLARTEQMTADPNCYGLVATRAAWDTPEGIVFRFTPADIGLRLPAAYSPDTMGDDRQLRRVELFCITADGRVHAPGG